MTNLFKKFCIGLIIGLMKDLVGMLKQSNLNTSTFQKKDPKKGLINIKNNDQNCFLWCHVRHVKPIKIPPERITQTDKEFANGLDYGEIKFPVDKDFSKIETKNNIGISVFCYENKLTFPIYISDQKFKRFVANN